MTSGIYYKAPVYTENDRQYIYYGSSRELGVNDLIRNAIQEAKNKYGGDSWELVEIDEYHDVVYEDDDDEKSIIDEEARVVVRRVT